MHMFAKHIGNSDAAELIALTSNAKGILDELRKHATLEGNGFF